MESGGTETSPKAPHRRRHKGQQGSRAGRPPPTSNTATKGSAHNQQARHNVGRQGTPTQETRRHRRPNSQPPPEQRANGKARHRRHEHAPKGQQGKRPDHATRQAPRRQRQGKRAKGRQANQPKNGNTFAVVEDKQERKGLTNPPPVDRY